MPKLATNGSGVDALARYLLTISSLLPNSTSQMRLSDLKKSIVLAFFKRAS